MTRRTSHLIALCSGALFLGSFLGVTTNLPRVQLRAAQASEMKAPGNAKLPQADPDKAPAGAQCKATKDCQPSLACIKVGDRKECTATVVERPKVPVVT